MPDVPVLVIVYIDDPAAIPLCQINLTCFIIVVILHLASVWKSLSDYPHLLIINIPDGFNAFGIDDSRQLSLAGISVSI